MKQILYGTLVRKSRLELEAEGTGNVLTKAILDVDDCVEGMRKFTTEIFDTGVALLAYACMRSGTTGSWPSLYDFPAGFLRDCGKDEGHCTENRCRL